MNDALCRKTSVPWLLTWQGISWCSIASVKTFFFGCRLCGLCGSPSTHSLGFMLAECGHSFHQCLIVIENTTTSYTTAFCSFRLLINDVSTSRALRAFWFTTPQPELWRNYIVSHTDWSRLFRPCLVNVTEHHPVLVIRIAWLGVRALWDQNAGN